MAASGFSSRCASRSSPLRFSLFLLTKSRCNPTRDYRMNSDNFFWLSGFCRLLRSSSGGGGRKAAESHSHFRLAAPLFTHTLCPVTARCLRNIDYCNGCKRFAKDKNNTLIRTYLCYWFIFLLEKVSLEVFNEIQKTESEYLICDVSKLFNLVKK